MRIGASLFLIGLGAILAFAVRTSPKGFDINTAGAVIMIIGILGLSLTAWWTNQKRTSEVITKGPEGVHETIYVTPNEPIENQPY